MNLRLSLRNVMVVLCPLPMAAWTQPAPLAASTPPQVVELNVVDGRTDGPATVRIRKGETVILRWRVDKPMALHVHGYDLQADARPGVPATLTIEGRYPGRFPVTVHPAQPRAGGGAHRETVLLYLEVHPE